MNINLIKILLEVREFSKNEAVIFKDYYYNNVFIESYSKSSKKWMLPSETRFIVAKYFGYHFEFNKWLNHETQNIEFERDMYKYLNLKAFS